MWKVFPGSDLDCLSNYWINFELIGKWLSLLMDREDFQKRNLKWFSSVEIRKQFLDSWFRNVMKSNSPCLVWYELLPPRLEPLTRNLTDNWHESINPFPLLDNFLCFSLVNSVLDQYWQNNNLQESESVERSTLWWYYTNFTRSLGSKLGILLVSRWL